MATLIDYILWRGDLTFEERPFNEVDNLILAELIYFDFDWIPELSDGRPGTLSFVYQRYQELGLVRTNRVNDPVPLMAVCAACRRYKDVYIQDFVNTVDPERQIQFAAGTFVLPNGEVYVSYRGTDNTIVGWREDCNLSYMSATPAQAESVRYLNSAIRSFGRSVRVGGHSKGGNLAVYAAGYCEQPDLVQEVYSNDGPGFNQLIAEDAGFRDVLPKVRLIIPEGSMIGIILSNPTEKEIVKSCAEGAMQHNPMTWEVECDHFVLADQQSSASIMLDMTLKKWLDSMDLEERKLFFSSVFDVLEASGAHTLADMRANPLLYYNAVVKAAAAQKPDVKDVFLDTVKKLALAGRDVIWDESHKKFAPFIAKEAKS